MKDCEILIVGSTGKSSPAALTASKLQKQLLRLEGAVRRVTSLDTDVQVVADEITAALRRGPQLLVLIGGLEEASPAGLAAATERELADGLPEGAAPLPSDERCLMMLVSGTQVLLVPEQPDAFERLWGTEIGPSLAEWFGHPLHARGELIVLGATRDSLEQLLESVCREHPAVNVHIGAGHPEGGTQVVVLASGHGERPRRLVDQALAEIERAATAARLPVSSTGRVAAYDAGGRA